MNMNALILKACAAILAASAAVSCSTTYDAYGRPVESVDPAAATVGIAAAGLAGYAIGRDRHDDRRRYYREPYYRDRYYRPRHYHHYSAPRDYFGYGAPRYYGRPYFY